MKRKFYWFGFVIGTFGLMMLSLTYPTFAADFPVGPSQLSTHIHQEFPEFFIRSQNITENHQGCLV